MKLPFPAIAAFIVATTLCVFLIVFYGLVPGIIGLIIMALSFYFASIVMETKN